MTPTGGIPPSIDDELLSAYLDGRVSPTERDAVDAALAADPATRARFTTLRATVTLVRALPQPTPRRTFVLTPEQAASIRPARGAWIARLFPAITAASAVAAVLCLALIAGDLATGGFATNTRQSAARPAVAPVAHTTATRVISATAAPTEAPLPGTAAAAATTFPPPAPASAASAARRQSAPAIGAAITAPTATDGAVIAVPPFTPTTASFVASKGALPATATLVANVQAPSPGVSTAPSGGATVTTETHRLPLPLLRAGELLLALLAVAGITFAVRGHRGKTGRT